MKPTRRGFLKVSGVLAAGAGISVLPWDGFRSLAGFETAAAAAPAPQAYPAPLSPLAVPAAAAGPAGAGAGVLAALNRAAFGPRPGDLAAVQQIGVDNWIDQQLAPETIDDSAAQRKLTELPTLTMNMAQLFDGYGRKAKPGPARVVYELSSATLLRAVYSERQLLETLVDFWSNHFNIYIHKDQCVWLKTLDDRDVVRKHALGNFHDLLLASAQSPAMLDFLDNRYNVKAAPNENYAREVMELHTLGVDGGYTQQDVEEVARCLTGWTMRVPGNPAAMRQVQNRPLPAPGFFFNARQHDNGSKQVLGTAIPAGGGIKDGLQVFDLLAHHPSTARFVATRLTRRFLADDPPGALVDAAAATFTRTGGDIRQTLGTLLHSDEFKGSFGKKARRPLEFVAAALRGLGADSDGGLPILNALNNMGQLPFNWQAPDGYPDTSAAWINTNGLLNRWNFALALATNKIKGTHVDLQATPNASMALTAAGLVDFWAGRLLGRPLAPADRAGLTAFVGAGRPADFELSARMLEVRVPELVALLMASPYFQQR